MRTHTKTHTQKHTQTGTQKLSPTDAAEELDQLRFCDRGGEATDVNCVNLIVIATRRLTTTAATSTTKAHPTTIATTRITATTTAAATATTTTSVVVAHTFSELDTEELCKSGRVTLDKCNDKHPNGNAPCFSSSRSLSSLPPVRMHACKALHFFVLLSYLLSHSS
jgi:hypothetical protein